MRVFVIRPFNVRNGFDFERVHNALINPALEELGALGGTTAATVTSGSIHETMFREIIDADVVLADVTVHNANVFYELGVRHALRPAGTILLRASRSAGNERDDIPFDIAGWRYVTYDLDSGSEAVTESVGSLVHTIRASLASSSVDSPVFRLFPDLQIDATGWNRVPLDLQEQIAAAESDRSPGDLRLLAEDISGLQFEVPALRLVAHAQRATGDGEGATRSWELVRQRRHDDFEANHSLATLFAQQGRLQKSEQAIERALRARSRTTQQTAELHGLRASNAKKRWRQDWLAVTEQAERRERALASPLLTDAINLYLAGFRLDLTSVYTGLNALALIELRSRLARAQPDVWRRLYDTDEDASRADDDIERLRSWLVRGVGVAIENNRSAIGPVAGDPWLGVHEADLAFLLQVDDDRVAARYRQALAALPAHSARSVRSQLEIFEELGVDAGRVAAVVGELGRDPAVEKPQRVVVFCGHMLDGEEEERREPRFPPDAADSVLEEIKRRLGELRSSRPRGPILGLAAASDGGDLLFHEACRQLKIPTEVLLPVPGEIFQAHGLSKGAVSAEWMNRYSTAVRTARRVRVLDSSVGLASWVELREQSAPWDRWSRWVLHHAVTMTSRDQVTALLLWDQRVPSEGDPGGVAGFAHTARNAGISITLIPMETCRSGGETTASAGGGC